MAECIGLYTTCLASMMRPAVGLAALELLREVGCDPIIPRAQTCCGQPAFNSGHRDGAKALARKAAAEFANCDEVVVPSGSCASTLRNHIPKLFAAGEPGQDEVAALGSKCIELACFLEKRGFAAAHAPAALNVAYHDSCAGLRELGIKQQPRKLLATAGHKLIPLENEEECCGFGGTFAVKNGALSGHIADRKCDFAEATKADVLALGEVGCLLSIEGRLLRRGSKLPVAHFAELLTSAHLAAA